MKSWQLHVLCFLKSNWISGFKSDLLCLMYGKFQNRKINVMNVAIQGTGNVIS